MTPPAINAMCVTPFDDHDRLDEDALAVLVDGLAAAGVGIYLGSYGSGEGHLLTTDEISRLYAVGVAAAAGRAPVYAAALGFTSTAGVIEAAHAAASLGVDAIQIHPPRPGPSAIVPRPAELDAFYSAVLGAVTSPVHLTNQVVMVGYRLPVELVAGVCASHPQVVAVNTSDPDLGAVGRLIRAVGATTPVYVGIIAQLPAALAMGGAGALCFEADVAPSLCTDVVSAYRNGDTAGLEAAFARLLELNDILSRFQNPRSVKAAMSAMGLPAGRLRPPYLALEPTEVATLREVLVGLGLAEQPGG